MKTQRERDDELIRSIKRMITFANPSFLRLSIVLLVGTLLGIVELAISESILAHFTTFVFLTLYGVAIVESSRFGYRFAQKNGGWKSTAVIVLGFVICFIVVRLFEYLSWLPLHRTAFWSLAIWFGAILGILAFFAKEDTSGNGIPVSDTSVEKQIKGWNLKGKTD